MDRWTEKKTYASKERRIVGQSDNVSEKTFTSSLERINRRVLIGKYQKHGRVWLFFKALFHKGLVEKGKQVESGKKIETKIDHSLFWKVTFHVVLQN